MSSELLRSSHLHRLAVLAVLLAPMSGCASAQQAGEGIAGFTELEGAGSPAHDVDRDEIAGAEAGSRSLGDLLRRFPSLGVRDHGSFLCVEFKRATTPTGAGVTRCPRQVAVVVDNVLMAEPESYLPSLRPRAVERIRFLQPSDATSRYGQLGRNGALLISTQSPGR